MTFPKSLSRLALVPLVMALTPACENDCRQQGCSSAVTVGLTAMLSGRAEGAPHEVELCTMGSCTTFDVMGTTADSPVVVTFVLPNDVGDGPITLTAALRDEAGDEVDSGSRQVTLTDFVPNGEDCPPVCKRGTALF